MSDAPKVSDLVRVNRPGTTILMPVVEYFGRVIAVDEAEGICDVLDDERRAPGEPGAMRRERISDCHVGWWERVWHEGRRDTDDGSRAAGPAQEDGTDRDDRRATG